MVGVRMGTDDPAESRVTPADLAEDLTRLGSRVHQNRLSRNRFGDQVAENRETAHQDLIDLKAHILQLPPVLPSQKTAQNPEEMYFFLDIRTHYKIIYKDIKQADVCSITKFLFLGGRLP
jgi:hypothetical protein